MRRKSMLTYGLVAAGAYLLYQHIKTSTTPPVITIAPPGVAGFGRLGYFPSGADRPFARMNIPGAGQPFARYNHGVRWY